MNSLAIGPHYPDINIQEAPLRHLEHEPHLGAGLYLQDTVRGGVDEDGEGQILSEILSEGDDDVFNVLNLIEEALLGVSVHCDEVSFCCCEQRAAQQRPS